MRYTSSRWSARPAAASSTALALLLALPAGAQTTTACAVSGVAYTEAAGAGQFTVTLACGAEGAEVPLDAPLVAGFTVYGGAYVEEDVADVPAPGPGGAERRIINDSFSDLHDFPAQELTLTVAEGEARLVFEAPAADLADRPWMLFALWRREAKTDCDPTSEYERQGCRDYGYVIGYDLESSLLLAYPALTWVEVGNEETGGFAPYVVERWIVERYK